jgi:hypothetical protein
MRDSEVVTNGLSGFGDIVSGAGTPDLIVSGLTAESGSTFQCFVSGPDLEETRTYDVYVHPTSNAVPLSLWEPATVSRPEADQVQISVVPRADRMCSYQWRRNGQPLEDDGRLVGSNWIVLEINQPTSLDDGVYDCVIRTGCSELVSNAVRIGACTGDINGDGLVDDSDFSFFVVAYNTLDCADPAMPANCPSDFTRDGVVDDQDFLVFVVAYNKLICD